MATMRNIVRQATVMGAALALLASGASHAAHEVGQPVRGATARFRVGDQVALGDWVVVVHGVRDPQSNPSPAAGPPAGSHRVALDIEVRNTGAAAAAVSALLCFGLHDAAGHELDEVTWSGVTPRPPDGEVEPSGHRRGWVVFDVPNDSTGLELHFRCDLFSHGIAVIALS